MAPKPGPQIQVATCPRDGEWNSFKVAGQTLDFNVFFMVGELVSFKVVFFPISAVERGFDIEF